MRTSIGPRGLILIVIVTLHVVLVHVLLRVNVHRRSVAVTNAMTVILVDEVRTAPPPRREPMWAAPALPALAPPTMPRLIETPVPEVPVESSTAITDWSGVIESVATAAVASERERQNRQSFTNPAPTIRSPRKRETERAPGKVEYFEDGAERHWVSSGCYIEFSRDRPLPQQTDLRADIITCPGNAAMSADELTEHLERRFPRKSAPEAASR
jgi:hypothetical protein